MNGENHINMKLTYSLIVIQHVQILNTDWQD